MTFWVWIEIVCHTCADTMPGVNTRGAIPRREMRRDAKEEGWVFKRNGDTFCSQACADKWVEIEERVRIDDAASKITAPESGGG